MGDIADTLVLVGAACPLAESAPVLGSFALALFLFDGGFFGNETFHGHEPLGRQSPRLDRRTHGARWLFFVFAVSESTVFGQGEDVSERSLDSMTARPQCHGPQSGGIDEPPSRRQCNKFRRHRGVTSALVSFAHLTRALNIAADEGIDKRRLSDPACTEQRDRSFEIRPEIGECGCFACADRMNSKIRGDGTNDRRLMRNLIRRHRVGLGEQNDGAGTAVEGKDQLALESPRVDTTRCGLQQEDDVDVRGDNMRNRTSTLE